MTSDKSGKEVTHEQVLAVFKEKEQTLGTFLKGLELRYKDERVSDDTKIALMLSHMAFSNILDLYSMEKATFVQVSGLLEHFAKIAKDLDERPSREKIEELNKVVMEQKQRFDNTLGPLEERLDEVKLQEQEAKKIQEQMDKNLGEKPYG